jgi:hypothetical protein
MHVATSLTVPPLLASPSFPHRPQSQLHRVSRDDTRHLASVCWLLCLTGLSFHGPTKLMCCLVVLSRVVSLSRLVSFVRVTVLLSLVVVSSSSHRDWCDCCLAVFSRCLFSLQRVGISCSACPSLCCLLPFLSLLSRAHRCSVGHFSLLSRTVASSISLVCLLELYAFV